MNTKAPFNFEEFYDAFGKSVSSDVIFVDGQVHIVRREKQSSTEHTTISPKAEDPEPVLPLVDSDGPPIKKHPKGRLLDSADRRRLPWSIRALLEAQESDGSWVYSSKFEFIINGTAPPPMAGISGKLWATAIAITVWRQFPEYFELLETNYERAMLHADENVIRIVRSVVQFDALDQIRPYKIDEARVIREQLAREAAAKRELELGEELKITRMREEEERIGKLSFVHARRLPISTQQLFVSELGNEFANVFSALPPSLTHDTKSVGSLKIGQLVECCRRRRTNSSALTASTVAPRWHLCRVTAVDEESQLLQLDFLDGDCERERRVPIKFVRATAAGIQEIRADKFEALTRSWSQPIACNDEITRLEEARAIKLKPLPWDDRHHLMLNEPARDANEKEPEQDKDDRPTSNKRPRSSTRRPTSQEKSRRASSLPTDSHFQAAANVLLQYDRAYARVQEAVQTGARRFTAAVLYCDRFHAFDELADLLVELVERTVDALEAILRWKQRSPNAVKMFVWKGSDFMASLVRSLDFLGGYRELVDWYGEEFPLDGNPFMRSTSLLDKAEERGLLPALQAVIQPQPAASNSTLRAALKLHRREASTSPTWWPEVRYSRELLRRIEQAEQALLADLAASLEVRVDQSVG